MGDVGIIEGGAVAIEQGRIARVGNIGAIESVFTARKVIDAGEKVVTPGFVDPHTHIVFAGDRLDEFEQKIAGADYLEILGHGGGILSTVRNTRAASPEYLTRVTLRRVAKMAEAGTTSIEIKTGYGLDLQTELKMLEVISNVSRAAAVTVVPTFLPAHAVPPNLRDDPAAHVEQICDEMLPAAWEWYRGSIFFEKVPFFADVFTEKNAFDVESSAKILAAAKRMGFELKAHVDEFNNLGGCRMAIELGATSVDHLDKISEAEVELLANSDAVGIVTPTVNFNLGSCEFADARKLIDKGCAIALSTDYNPGSAPCPSQQMTMALACRFQKLSPAEAFNAVTINAAYGCGLGQFAGSIEAGKWADILVLDTQDFREAAYEFGGNIVSSVFKKGDRVV